MQEEEENFHENLTLLCAHKFGERASDIKRLSGGASQESWQFRVGARRFILRRTPGGARDDAQDTTRLPLASEAQIIRAAGAGGLAVPDVPYICVPEDGVGHAYIMGFVEGETIARKILRDTEFASVRDGLAAQCGKMAAGVHALDVNTLPALPYSDAADALAIYKNYLHSQDHPYPVFELAFQWLEKNIPPKPAQAVLVHGDFRHGNLMIAPDKGIVAILDWELAHIGDPMEDLGWLCVPSWRFGIHEKPVGGFGERQALYDAYTAAGGKVDERVARFWEIFGCLKWGIMCAVLMVNAFYSGRDTSVERAAIGRRSSETEIDLLRMLKELD